MAAVLQFYPDALEVLLVKRRTNKKGLLDVICSRKSPIFLSIDYYTVQHSGTSWIPFYLLPAEEMLTEHTDYVIYHNQSICFISDWTWIDEPANHRIYSIYCTLLIDTYKHTKCPKNKLNIQVFRKWKQYICNNCLKESINAIHGKIVLANPGTIWGNFRKTGL